MSDLRFTKEGVPIYDGTAESYVPYRRAALNYVETLEWKKRSLAGPRLQAALEGTARIAVQDQVPGWISHDSGALQLLNYLKSRVQPPTLAEAGKMITRFFYSIKRRRGESMNNWILRHDEALFEARRTLAEAIHEYGSHATPPVSSHQPSVSRLWETSRNTRSSVSSSSGRQDQEYGPFDPSGRLREDEDDDGNDGAASHHEMLGVNGTKIMTGIATPGGIHQISGGTGSHGLKTVNNLSYHLLESMMSLWQPQMKLTSSCRTLWWLGCSCSVLAWTARSVVPSLPI